MEIAKAQIEKREHASSLNSDRLLESGVNEAFQSNNRVRMFLTVLVIDSLSHNFSLFSALLGPQGLSIGRLLLAFMGREGGLLLNVQKSHN